jgi:hypothetical protein
VRLHAGDIFVVPRGTEHKPSSDGGAILMFEPSGTLTTGDRHEGEIPGHVDSTAGHEFATPRVTGIAALSDVADDGQRDGPACLHPRGQRP